MTHRIQQESIKRRLAKLAAPIFIETLLIMMLGAVDTIMLSRHSDNSVAAVGVVNQIIMLTFLVFELALSARHRPRPSGAERRAR